MIKQTDIKGRLNLLRYGLVVIVAVAFIFSLVMPYMIVSMTGQTPDIMSLLPLALLLTGSIAILCVMVYFAYKAILERNKKDES